VGPEPIMSTSAVVAAAITKGSMMSFKDEILCFQVEMFYITCDVGMSWPRTRNIVGLNATDHVTLLH
jgi:hypothetical protein